jgi:hypothetical protein
VRANLGFYFCWTLLVVLGACCSGCNRHDDPKLETAPLIQAASQFVPQDALDKLNTSGLPWVQIDFNVRRKPLRFAFSDSQLNQALSDRWTVCRPKTAEWTAFQDVIVTPSRYVQRRTYVLFRNGVLIVLMGNYSSANEATSIKKLEDQGEMPVQHGVVIARNANDHEARAVAESQALSCDDRSPVVDGS